MRKYIYTILLLFAGSTLSAQTPAWAFNIGSTTDDFSTTCKTAPNGNVVIAGEFSGTLDLDPGPGVYNVTSNGIDDIFVACYTSTGTFLWGFSIGGPSYDGAWYVTIDRFNNVFVCGHIQSAGIDFDPGPGTAILPYVGGTGSTYEGDGFIAKYTSTGVFRWAKDLGGPTVYDIALSLGTDELGDVYVGGVFNTTMTISPTITFNSAANGTAYLIKYDSVGNVIWGHNYGLFGTGGVDCFPRSLQVSHGYIYVGGYFQGTSSFNPWAATPTILTSVGFIDPYVAKYDTAGNLVFVRQIQAPGGNDNEFGSLALDPSDNIYLTGWINSSSIVFDPTSPATSTVAAPGGGGNFDMIMAKFNSSGVYQWGTLIGNTGDDLGRCIDASGSDLVCTGEFHNTVDFDPSAAVSNLTSTGGYDIFVGKYDLNGNYLCAFGEGSATSDDVGYGVTHDAAGNVINVGQFGGTAVDFDPTTGVLPLTSNGGLDAYAAMYSYTGAPTFTGSLTGSTICFGDSAQLTLTVTSGGPGPYTIVYSDGTTSHTLTGVVSGTPFTVSPNPTSTTIYSIVSITTTGAAFCSTPSGSGLGTATVVVSTCGGCDSLHMPDSLHLCYGDTITMPATITGTNTLLSLAWTPATGLSSTTILHPLLTATVSGWYDLTIQSLIPNNLVVNGDFSAGNTGFTSSYIYSPPPSTVLNEGYYSVYNNPFGVHTGFLSFGDHTTGTGNMMIINGGAAATSLWCETIPVVPNTTYDFSAWFANCSAVTTGANVPILQFMVNGILLGAPTTVSAAPGTWVNFFSTWNSGANTSATICIYDEVTTPSGNDFVIDDISFEQICKTVDSIYVKVTPPDTTYRHGNDSMCTYTASIILTAPTGYHPYLWNTGDTAATVHISAPGTYWVYATGNCAMLIDSTYVKAIIPDTTSAYSNDSMCASVASLTLTAPVGHASYLWNTGSASASVNVTIAGAYWVYAKDICAMLIDTFNVIVKPVPPPPHTRDTLYCVGFNSPASLATQVDSVPGTLNWYNSTGTSISGTPVFSTGTQTYPNGTTWYVSQTVGGCESDSTPVNISIIAPPNTTISPAWVCQYDSISLTFSSVAFSPLHGGFLWTLPPGSTAVGGTQLTDSLIVVKFDSVSGDNYVYLTSTYLSGECNTVDTTRIDVIPLPFATAYSKEDVCLEDTVSLALSYRSPNAGSFTWLVDNSPLSTSSSVNIIASNSNSGGPFSISWADTGIHIIHVTAFTEQGCTSPPTADTVNVHPLPDAAFTITTTTGTLCLEDSVRFAANDSNYQNKYSWTPAHFFTITSMHDVWGKVELAHSVVTLTVTDPFGCTASYSKELDPDACCTVAMPNAFSPNGDGLNDFYRPVFSGYHSFHIFRINNRWGQTVFESTNSNMQWDGTFNGVPQDIGVYFYYIKYDCGGKTIEQKGDCTLIR